MDEDYEQSLKLSVFNKVKQVNHLINEVTIGPQSLRKPTFSPKVTKEFEPSREASKESTLENHDPMREFIRLLELERLEKVRSAINKRMHIFEEFSRTQEAQSKQSWQDTKQAFLDDVERQQMEIIQANQQYDLKQSMQHEKMAQLSQNAILRMKQKQELLKEKEKQRQRQLDNINTIKVNQEKFNGEYKHIAEMLRETPVNKEQLKAMKLDISILTQLASSVNSCVKTIMHDLANHTEEHVKTSEEALIGIVSYKTQLAAALASIRQKEQQKTEPPTPEIQNEPKNPVISRPPQPEEEPKKLNSNLLNKYVSANNLTRYLDLMQFLKDYRLKFKQLEEDQSLKNFKFDCKKAINIPVNALSGVNSKHIMDKYTKLHRLLSGQSVIVTNKEVNASKHPQGIAFCTDLLAKKFVLQGDLMVSSNPESAFCYASVILSLWNDFPDFGTLLLAYFYKMCPFTVPYNIPREVGESDEEYYTKLGYQYTEGNVEKQDKFLKRMTGILRLYFALWIAKPKSNQTSSPYNLKFGWAWLASLLKLEPQIDITATAMHVFLEIVGFEMDARYGKMFQRVLKIIVQVFLPKCKAAKCTGGAVTRLELLLSKYMEKHQFEQPSGYVEYAFW